MATDYPGAIDTTKLTNPATTDKRNSPSHAGLHDNANDAIKAVETKIGTGSSTPATNTLLFGTGAGTSAWQTLTSANLAAILTDETGTGSAVFATTPTLVTPKIDTINESTSGNGTTIGGVNIKSGALNTNNSVVSANIANAAVTPSKLSLAPTGNTTATSGTTTSTSFTSTLTSSTAQTATVTVGANGILLIGIWGQISNSGANLSAMGFALSGTNTLAASNSRAIANTGTSAIWVGSAFLVTGLNTGVTVVTTNFAVAAGTGTYAGQHIWALPL